MFSVIEFFREILFLVGYVSTSSSFPEPLPEEEARLINLYCNNGDREAHAKLVEHNLRLVAHISKKYIKTGLELDELISIGAIGLVKAVSTFKPDKGSLSAYASRCIENEILMFMRTERKRSAYEVSIDDPMGQDSDGNEVTLSDRLYSDGDDVQEKAYRQVYRERLEKAAQTALDERERAVIDMRYNLNGEKPLTQLEVAQKLNVSRSYVSRIEKKALKKLSKFFSE